MSGASSAGAVRAGKAYVELFTEDSKFNRGLTAAQNRLKAFGAASMKAGAALAAAGTAIGGSTLAAAKQFASAGDEVHKMNLRTGIATEFLSQMAFAASQSGSSLQDFELGIKGMANTMLAAQRGSAEVVSAFTALGVSVDDLKGKRPEEQFLLLAEKIAAVKDPTRRAALAMKIFQESGQKLLPLMMAGRQGIEDMMRAADAAGMTLDQDAANSAAALTDAIDKMTRSAKAFGVMIGGAVAPELTAWIEKVQENIPAVTHWISMNKGLVLGVGKLSVALAGAGTAMVAIGVSANTMTAAMGAAKTSSKLLYKHAGMLGALGIGAAFYAFAKAIFASTDAAKALNRELEKTVRLNDQLRAKDQERTQATIDKSKDIANPVERRKFLEDELAKKQAELSTHNSGIQAAQQRLDDKSGWLNTAIDLTYGSGALESERSDIRDLEARADSARSSIEALKGALKELGSNGATQNRVTMPGETEKSSNPIAALVQGTHETIKNAPAEQLMNSLKGFGAAAQALQQAAETEKERQKVETEAMKSEAEGITDATRTPLEKLTKELNRLDTLFKKGYITEETLQRASKMAQLEAGQKITADKTQKEAGKIGAAAAVEAGSAEAQRQILAALSPNVSIERKSLELQKEIEALTRSSNRSLGALVKLLTDAGLIKVQKVS